MRRNRVFILLLLPIITFLWFIGWTLYWIGSRHKSAWADATSVVAVLPLVMGDTCAERFRVEAKQLTEKKKDESC